MRYYSTQRPIMPGGFPKPSGNKVTEVQNFDGRVYCEEIGREAWGYIEYEHPISDELRWQYDLAEGGTAR